MEIGDSTNMNKNINKQINLLKREKKTGIIFNWDISTLYTPIQILHQPKLLHDSIRWLNWSSWNFRKLLPSSYFYKKKYDILFCLVVILQNKFLISCVLSNIALKLFCLSRLICSAGQRPNVPTFRGSCFPQFLLNHFATWGIVVLEYYALSFL